MALGIVKYFYDHPSQPIGVIWFAVSCRGPILRWLFDQRIKHRGKGQNASLSIYLLNQKSWDRQIWHASWCSPKVYKTLVLSLMASSK